MAQKPKINDVIGNLINCENLNIALEFITYLKNNKISIQWANKNTWKVVKKGVSVCYIKAGIERDSGTSCYVRFIEDNDSKKGSWVILPHIIGLEKNGVDNRNGYEKIISNKKIINIIWSKVRSCSDCGNTKKCAPGINIKLWGKELKNCCKFIAIPFLDPNPEELECIKMLINVF
jgi:hypothetical protein